MQGLYLHIPFCEKKCVYCDFYSIESTDLMEGFVGRLCTELSLRATTEKPCTSIFFGGGTPSLLSPTQLERILDRVHAGYSIAPDAECTMECNPGTVTLENLKAYRSMGINRLSFGVQSFVAEELSFLARIHSADDADKAMELARAAGFDNVNMDLMFALPPQTLASLGYSIDRMLALGPDHISAYSLIFEPGTPLYAQWKKGHVHPHAEDLDAEMYAYVMDRLGAAGYEQYEVSNFARNGRTCLHNLTYWHADPYIAVGPSAHGLLDNTRYWNHRSLAAWGAKIDAGVLPQANTEVLDRHAQLVEYAFLHMRADGLPVQAAQQRFGIDLRRALQPQLQHWIDAGMVRDTGNTLRLTRDGYTVCDDITVALLDALDRASASATT
ncbi:MAG: radical SAM family heme chaperone HemW [Candidatus Kapabacteria bacterium]|nr:radical SAM family heme chaperone HemW [Candidatus Kapabacteria bacterium]